MREIKIYLAGACKNLTNEERNGWRYKVEKALVLNSKKNVKVVVPDKYFNYDEQKHKTEEQVQDYFLWCVRTSDIVIVNLDGSDCSVGTGMETQHAKDNNIPVIGFGTHNIYPWTKNNCQVVFEDIDEAIQYVFDYYLDQ